MRRCVEEPLDPHTQRWWGERVHVVLNGWCIWFRRLDYGTSGYEAGWWSILAPSDSAVDFHNLGTPKA